MSFQANWDWLWCPGLSPMLVPTSFPSPYLSVFPFTLLHLPLDFIRLFFTAAVSAPHHQPSSCTRAWDRHRATVDPEAELHTYIHTYLHVYTQTYITIALI